MDELAAEHGFSYEVAKADIDEKAIRHEDARHLVLRLAHAKAAAIAARLAAAAGGAPPSGLLITCDQVGSQAASVCRLGSVRSCRARKPARCPSCEQPGCLLGAYSASAP